MEDPFAAQANPLLSTVCMHRLVLLSASSAAPRWLQAPKQPGVDGEITTGQVAARRDGYDPGNIVTCVQTAARALVHQSSSVPSPSTHAHTKTKTAQRPLNTNRNTFCKRCLAFAHCKRLHTPSRPLKASSSVPACSWPPPFWGARAFSFFCQYFAFFHFPTSMEVARKQFYRHTPPATGHAAAQRLCAPVRNPR